VPLAHRPKQVKSSHEATAGDVEVSLWPQKSLGEVAVIERDSIQPGEIKTGTSYLGLEHIESGGKILSVPEVSNGDLASSKFRFTSEHILYGKLRPYLAKIACPDFNGICSTDILPILPNVFMDKRYICYFLRQPDIVALANSRSSGANLPRLSPTSLSEILLPVPPLSEQKRIAEILDRAEALRAKRRAALALLDELTQSIFLDMFGDAEVQGSKWPVHKIAEYVDELQGGKSLESNDDNSSQYRVLKVSAVTGMKFRPEESKPIDDDYEPPEDHYVRNGDLLFSRANTTELVGAVAYVTNCPQNLLLPDKLWRFVWKDKKAVHPLFVWYLFQTRPVRREIGNRATGTSGSMKNISKEKLFGIPTILPPIELQRTFADRIIAIERMQDRQKESLSELDQLFASLQHRAFRGEL
jgi:type I restriction enzyme, S subunit